MVGMTRFERATPSSQARCATKLRYIPIIIKFSILRCSLVCLIYGSCGNRLTRLPSSKLSSGHFFAGNLLHPDNMTIDLRTPGATSQKILNGSDFLRQSQTVYIPIIIKFSTQNFLEASA